MVAAPAAVVALEAQLLVPADLAALVVRLPLRVQLLLVLAALAPPEARLPLRVRLLLVPADLAALVAQLLVLADLVVLVAAVPLQLLLNRQSFSAAMARNTP